MRILWHGVPPEYNTGYGVVCYKDKRIPEFIGMADPPFFQIFTFPLISGDSQTALHPFRDSSDDFDDCLY